MTEAIQNANQATAASGRKPFFVSAAGGMSLATVNQVLYVLTAVIAVFFVVTLLAGGVRLAGVDHHIKSLEAKGKPAAAAATDEPAVASKSASDAALANRNIFQPAGMAVVAGEPVAVSTSSSTYRLVGISASKNIDETYVMVENTQTKITYFLQYRQPVEGLELERILEDKVIVKIGGKTVELE